MHHSKLLSVGIKTATDGVESMHIYCLLDSGHRCAECIDHHLNNRFK